MIKKIGDWASVTAVVGNLAKEMEAARQVSLKRWALKAEAISKTHMSKQDLGWQPLAASTIAAKARKGDSSLILIATSDYFLAITSWVTDGVAYAGVRKQIRNSKGQVLADIARVHEFGRLDGSIKARPLWQPTFKEVLAWYKSSDSTPEKLFEKNIQKYL